MKKFLSEKIFKRHDFDEDEMEADEEYVELDTDTEEKGSEKVIVQPFKMEEFGDVKEILQTLREGFTICLINIRPLREKDMVELKRAINKIKKTCEAVDGDIAGYGDDYVIVVPSFAEIHKGETLDPSEEQ